VAVLLKNYATSGARILFILCPRISELDIELILVLLNFFMRILILFIQFPVSKQKEATVQVILIARIHTYPHNMRGTATVN